MKNIELLEAELLRYPTGHVCRSVGRLELIPKEVALTTCDLIRGSSYNMFNQPTERWIYQVVTDDWDKSPEKVKKFADKVAEELRKHFWGKGAFWGVAPKEKIIL